MSSRWSLKNALRLVRAARGATDRSATRHGRIELADRSIRKAIERLNAAEAELMRARTFVWLARGTKRHRRAA